MIGAPGQKRKADGGSTSSEPPPKAYKGTVVDLFKQPPIDVTTQKSKYEVYTQAQATTSPLEIVVDRSSTWKDMSKMFFEYDVQFTQADGATLLQNTARVAPVNNFGHSLIKQFQVLINGQPITTSASEYYHLEAYMDRLTNYSQAEKDTWLSLEGWYTDEPGKFETLNPLPAIHQLGSANYAAAGANGEDATQTEMNNWVLAVLRDGLTNNKGAQKRHAVCCQNRVVKIIIQPVIPMFSCKRYLPPGCELKFKIQWNTPEVALMADPNDPTQNNRAPRFNVVPYSPKIHLREVEVNSELGIKMEKEMMVDHKIAFFPHFGCRVVTQAIVDGRRRHDWMNVFQGSCPNYMMVGFLRAAALNGSYEHSFTNFTDMNQSSIRVTRKGEEIPYQRLDVQNSHFRELAYNTMLHFSGQGVNSSPIGISREDFMNGNYLLMFNFNPDGELNYNYDYQRNNENVNISVDFSADTANTTTMVVFGYFEQQGWLDGDKNFTLRYPY